MSLIRRAGVRELLSAVVAAILTVVVQISALNASSAGNAPDYTSLGWAVPYGIMIGILVALCLQSIDLLEKYKKEYENTDSFVRIAIASQSHDKHVKELIDSGGNFGGLVSQVLGLALKKPLS